jgi:hypothetical protein
MKTLGIVLVGSALLASGAVAAKDASQTGKSVDRNQFYGLYQNQPDAMATARDHRTEFDRSGTVGREGLGASPFKSEGPGNFAD